MIQFVYENRPDLAGALAISKPMAASVAAPDLETAASDDAIKDKVLEIVAEKTGYPKDMLDLDLDLEADLGVDTVKQAEMFASVRAAYNIPRDADLKLRDFPTLAHVIKFARDRAGKAVPTLLREPAAPQTPDVELATFEATNRVPRRVPVPVLRPPLKMCKPTGVMLAAGKRVVVMPDKSGVAGALVQKLKEIGVEVLLIEGTPDSERLVGTVKTWVASGAVDGVFWLPALDGEGKLSEMNPTTWREALQVRVKLLYHAMRNLYEQVAPKGPFLIFRDRMGGQHGYDEGGALNPLGGAVTGFTKAYKRERMDALVKAVDFESGLTPHDMAELLIAESLQDPGAIEIGYKNGLRWSVGLEEQLAADGQSGMKLSKESVFVVTGAAGSIVSAITSDLAAASGGTFYLLDLVPEPDPANPDLARFSNDRENLKLDLFRRMQARGERATPALVEKELAALERGVAAKNAIDAVKAAGGMARYFSVDTDATAVAQVIEQVRKSSGRIDVLLHAAGMERSHFLPAKDPRNSIGV